MTEHDVKPVALVIDGKNLLYRSLMSKGGEPVEVDFPRRLLDLRDRYKPHFAILTWDADGPTWRHAAYADYKGQREAPSPYELGVYARVPGWGAQCGYQFVEAHGWEADDIIGTYAARLREGFDVVIVSNDKDLTQLLGPGVTMLKGWTELITHEQVEQPSPVGWGVKPHFIPDLLAIMGDSSDNIPGVPKIGEKGAVKLITEFGDVEAIIAAAREGRDKAAGRSQRIIDHAEALRLFKRLTTVSTGVAGLPQPVPCSAMTVGQFAARVEPEGMTAIDGVLYPLPETAHMAKALGWRWTNPTSAVDRKQPQLRPGEPIERWEREDHWAYLVERGGQWTLTHRGIDGDVETGKAHVGEALGEFYAIHVAYRLATGAHDGPWDPSAPVVDAAAVALRADEAKRIFEANRQALYTGGTFTSLTSTVAPTQALPPPPLSPPLPPPPPPPADVPGIGEIETSEPVGVSLAALELDAPDGAVAIGLIEFPAGATTGLAAPAFAEIRVEMTGPQTMESAPLVTASQEPAVVIFAPAAVEYWCAACSQLRLSSSGPPDRCGNCGAAELLTGPPGTLDADALRRSARTCPASTYGVACDAGTVCPPGECAQEKANALLKNRQTEPTAMFGEEYKEAAAQAIAAAYGVPVTELPTAPPTPPPKPVGPWAIPTDPTPGKETIPIGYTRTIVALALEAFTGEPHTLVWDVDLKTDYATPPDDPNDPNRWVDGRHYATLCRLHDRVIDHVGDPAALKPLGVVVHGVHPGANRDRPPVPVFVEFEPNLVNLARIANGPTPVGRWLFAPVSAVETWAPRLHLSFFSDIPF